MSEHYPEDGRGRYLPAQGKPPKRLLNRDVTAGLESGEAVLERYKALAAKRAVQPVVNLTVLAVTTPKEEAPALMSAAERQCVKRAVIAAVSGAVGIPARDILSVKRAVPLARARQTMAWMLMKQRRTRLALSYPEVGRIMEGRDHTTVMHAVKRVERSPDTFQPIVDRACEILGWPRMVIGG